MKKYQGEDVYFSLNFDASVNPYIHSFNDLENVIVYLYCDESNIIKFSKVTKAGYEPLVNKGGLGMVLEGMLKSSHTYNMEGQIMIDVMCVKPSTLGDLKENVIQKAMSGIFMLPSIIKAEA